MWRAVVPVSILWESQTIYLWGKIKYFGEDPTLAGAGDLGNIFYKFIFIYNIFVTFLLNKHLFTASVWLMLKLQYFGHLMQRPDSLEKTLMMGKTEGRRRGRVTDNEMVGWHHQINAHESEQTPGDSEGQGSLACCTSQGCRVGHDVVAEQVWVKHWKTAFLRLGGWMSWECNRT